MNRGCIVSSSPLVILSSINYIMPLGVASARPELFAGRKSLHLLSPAWSLHGQYDKLVENFVDAAKTLPGAEFLFLANEEEEFVELQSRGLATVLASTYLFVDENTFRPMPEVPKIYDALYNATFRTFKNHQLCRCVKSLALIHYYHSSKPDLEDVAYEQEVRRILAHAKILNEMGNANYARLSLREVAHVINRSRSSLCLSDREGAMRACCESLMCGVPVVSIPAAGGRMRYLNSSNSRIVEAEPEAVALAVEEFARLNPDAQSIRRDFLSILEFERRNFLTVVNIFAARIFGVDELLKDFSVFQGSINYKSHENWEDLLAGTNGTRA